MAWSGKEITLDQFKASEPIYLLIRAERINCIMEFNCPRRERTWGGKLGENAVYFKKSSFNGEIKATGAKLTLAKELLVPTEDKLSSSSGDLGIPADKITFDFETEFYKGFILKIYLDENSEKMASEDVYLELKVDIDGKEDTLKIPLTFAESDNEFIFATGGMAREARIAGVVLPYAENSTLEQRNKSFRNNLAISSRIMGVERWMRAKYLNNEIDGTLMSDAIQMSLDSWTNTYSDEYVSRFNRRFNQLKFMSDRNVISPLRLYGALNTLMKGNR